MWQLIAAAWQHLEALSIVPLLDVVELPKQACRKLVHQRQQRLQLHSTSQSPGMMQGTAWHKQQPAFDWEW